MDAIITYRYLRVGLVALVVLLLVSTLITGIQQKCPLGSISAYFYTTTHAVFVAALCAVGSCLIIYKGQSRTEDLLLNFSGISAFVVAFVPTKAPENPCGGGLPTREGPFVGVGNNIGAAAIAGLVGIGVYLLLRRLQTRFAVVPTGIAPQRAAGLPGWLLTILTPLARLFLWVERKLEWFLLAILVVGVVVFFAKPTLFEDKAHAAAAILTFAGMIGVAVLHAVYAIADRPTASRFFASGYILIAGYMAGMVVATFILAWQLPGYWTLAAEVLLILGFAAFWFLQTLDMWNIGECQYSGESLTRARLAMTAQRQERRTT